MSNTNKNGGQGMLVLRQEMPLYGRFSLLVSDAYCVEVTETEYGVRFDFRRRTLGERIALWRRKLGL